MASENRVCADAVETAAGGSFGAFAVGTGGCTYGRGGKSVSPRANSI